MTNNNDNKNSENNVEPIIKDIRSDLNITAETRNLTEGLKKNTGNNSENKDK
ncbi:hypothetical protein [Fusobacterium sp. PH5-44]|uniref:hypothetical protein n=1 Tax=unclassified Fusobacterium TaxID=2648384 RepID=UPI003D2358FC